MRFYSQCGEDKALLPLFGRQHKGYFVDVGALDGIGRSNTYFFERLGWIGICIEPHKHYFSLLMKNRPKSVCVDVAVWDVDAETSDFYATKAGTWSRVGSPPSLEVLKRLGHHGWYARARQAGIQVQHPKLRTLDHILEQHNAPTRFELLSIDVEHTEWHVLKGFSLGRYLPRIVIIEDLFMEGFNSYFGPSNYTQVRARKSHNTIYCRDREDAKTVKKNWV